MNRTLLNLLALSFLSMPLAACNEGQLAPSPIEEGHGTISGRVCGPQGDVWLADAHVWVVRPDSSLNETYTDVDGNFTLENVLAGTQTLFIEKGSFSSQQDVEVTEGEATVLTEQTCIDPASAHVAVVTGDWDSIEDILTGAGITDITLYDGMNGTSPTDETLLTDLSLMSGYDIIFLNCGQYPASFFTNPTIINNLRSYVDAGGSLYSSDWAYDFVEIAFPEAVDYYGDDNMRNAGAAGVDGPITASVTDAALAAALGRTSVQLNYDLPQWVVPTGASGASRVLVQGNATAFNMSTFAMEPVADAPLAVQFGFGQNGGSVVYTSFHNEQQATADMNLILTYMIFEL